MESRRSFILSVLLLLLVTLLSLSLVHWYSSHYVMMDGTHYDISSTELNFSGQSLETPEALVRFPHLKKLDLRGTSLTPAQFDTIRQAHPDCEILWDVPFQGRTYSSDRRNLTITTLSDEDLAMLAYFPNLQYINAEGCRDYENLLILHDLLPQCRLEYSIDILGTGYDHGSTHLFLPGQDLDTLSTLLPCFPDLRSVTLVDPTATPEQIDAFRRSHPDLDINWQLNLGGVTVDESTTTLDLTGVPLTVEEVHRLIAYFPNLTYLDLSDSGISNEDMAVLRDSYDHVKIVWTVSIGRYLRVKTDITWFMPVKYGVYVTTPDLYNLRYCRDIVCLDIGHMDVDNCDFVSFMPHLKYLLMADTEIYDLAPLSGLTELIYLELFLTEVTDYAPLLTLTSLEDLNLHYTYGDPSIIAQMTWLKNLWWNGMNWQELLILQEALPNTHFEYACASSTGNGWRKLENYYAQRDILGMWYMTG